MPVSLPATRIVSNYNVADGALGAEFSPLTVLGATTMTIAGMRAVAGDGYQGAYRNDIALPGAAEVGLYCKDAYDVFWGVLLIDPATGNGWQLSYNPDNGGEIRLLRYDAATPTQVDMEPYTTPTKGDALLLRRAAGTISGWLYHAGAWTLMVSFASSAYATGGRIAKHTYDPFGVSASWDDLFGGPVPTSGDAPTNVVEPELLGVPETGQVMTVSPGTWAGDATIAFDYQWQREGEDIAGATSSTYTLVLADESGAVRCRVTAWNPAGVLALNTATVEPIASTEGMDDIGVKSGGNWVTSDRQVKVDGVWT